MPGIFNNCRYTPTEVVLIQEVERPVLLGAKAKDEL